MYSEGDKVWYHFYSEDGTMMKVAATVTSTFYEPGDPVQGVNLKTDEGKVYGGVDSQNCTPRD